MTDRMCQPLLLMIILFGGMRKRSVILPVLLILSLTLIKCIDPYYPKLEKYQSLLVVDALLTDEDLPASVRITRTTETRDEVLPMVTGCLLYTSPSPRDR